VKNIVLIPSTLVFTALLSGCAGDLARLRDTYNNPAYQAGADKSTVLARAGTPLSRIRILDGTGECFNYNRTIEGKTVPFYVGFNQRGTIVGTGYDATCSEAAAQGRLSRSEPEKQ